MSSPFVWAPLPPCHHCSFRREVFPRSPRCASLRKYDDGTGSGKFKDDADVPALQRGIQALFASAAKMALMKPKQATWLAVGFWIRGRLKICSFLKNNERHFDTLFSREDDDLI